MATKTGLDQHDVDILRKLAGRKAKIAFDPINLARRKQWLDHDAGEGCTKPMVLAEVCGVMNEVMPDTLLQCTDPGARGMEKGLRMELYQFEELKDDHVVEPWVNLNWKVAVSNYGVQSVQHHGSNDGKMGARRWDPPIQDLDRDFDKLRARTYSVDRAGTMAEKERLEAIFGDTLRVRIRGGFWWTLGMTITAIDLIGLENLMLYMFDNPDGLHRLMKFLHDDHLAYAQWLEKEGLLTLNNENDYIGSGSMGYSRRLPCSGCKPCGPVSLADTWVLLESQETVGVGPDQFEEFIFPYQLSLSERFGLCYYGCCEPVHTRWHVLKKMPNLDRVSISPWCDEEFMAREMGRRYVYSRKPNPTQVSTSVFDEAAIRADLRKTLTVAKGCRVEFAMKDVHTLANEPKRLPRWVQLARETIDEVWK